MKTMKAICKIESLGPGKLQLTFEDGQVMLLSITDLVGRGPVFEPLNDTKIYEQCQIIDNGIALAWPGEIEISAETAFRLSKQVDRMPLAEPRLG